MKMMSKMPKFLALTALIVVLGAALVPPLYGGCFVWNDCGAWCEVFGDCFGYQECENYGFGVSCRCGLDDGFRVAFGCDGTINMEYF